MAAEIKGNELKAICGTLADLRAVLDVAQTEAPERQAAMIERAMDSTCRDLCRILGPHNPRFDAARFLSACGVKGAR